MLDDPASPLPSFVPNVAGTYTATLNVNDGTVTVKDTVVITTNANRNPVARTEADDVALANGETIQLDASDSTDTNGGLLAYAWTVTKRPGGSNAPLVGASTPRPTFTADKAGSYTFTVTLTDDPGGLTASDTQLIGTPLPQANAGPDQLVTLGAPVTLDGSPSSHLGATAALAYGWALISTPAGSLAEIDDPIDPQPHFVADLAGTYIAQLIVFDGTRLSKADTVTIRTDGNLPPRVDLGADRHTTVGGLVTVDALATDPNLDPLTFSWMLLSRPAGSAATLSGASGTPVQLTPDVAGDYIVQLTATDTNGLAGVDTLLITTGNTTPTVTGPGDAAVTSGVPVPLSATASDPDGGAITYLWSLLAKPTGSASVISSPSAAAPTFTPDEDGVYVVQLLVRDNRKLYAVDAAVFRVGGAANEPPLADAGSPQTVVPGALVALDGSGSSDPESQPLTYAWSFVSKPAGSVAAFSSPTASNPTFTADLGGTYVARLIVNDGSQDSAPSEVTITADAPPTANAGPDQIGVDLGVAVNLTGAASTDPESQPLTYAWSFTSKPAGSTATLASPTSVTPSFIPDVAGIYVVQLIVDDGLSASPVDTVSIDIAEIGGVVKLTTVGVSTRFTAGAAALCAAVLLISAYVAAQGPLTAKAGPDQQGMYVGDTVHLDGTASIGATSYAWTFTKRPSGSTAVLTNPLTATPTFVPDRGGLYTVKLTVGNGVTTSSDTVNITPANRPPVANAGPDISSALAKSVTLDGTGSSDPDLNKLTYAWTLVSQPPASVSALAKATTSKATLFLDRPGTYVAQLVVKDGALFSAPDQVTITTTNVAPVADAGPDRLVAVGGVVQLNGTASSDADENTLTYLWTLKRPKGSTAVLDNPASPMPSFVPNVAGTYTATLNVNDGTVTVKDTVVITTNANRPPVARTEADDVALANGETIQLDASDSTDTNGGLLAYAWTVTKRPGGSSAPLVGASTPRPTFTADKAGSYTFSVTLTDDPGGIPVIDTQVIGTPLPQANAGPDQVVTLGAPVTLDGSQSSHLGATAALGYGWALISTPAGSLAEIDDPTDPQPHFIADLAGTYVAQLILFDGTRLSKADTVTISTNGNLPPRVDLGPDRHTTVGGLVTVDALATDPNLDPLTFSWMLLSRPAGSAATLSGASGTPVHLTPDVAGDYIVQLTATDANGLAGVDTLLITTGNTTPTVIGPADAAVPALQPVPLSATASDPDGGAITYLWSLLSKPSGSAAAISSPSAAAPTFTPDQDGVYVVQLLVRDTRKLYAVDAAVFRVGGAANQPPIADAGSPQTVAPGALVALDGSGSSDPESQPLTYAWSFVSKPAGSVAAFSSPTASNPTFTADLGGTYVARLIVNDGSQDSAPSEVTITADGAPTANAGPDQIGVNLGVAVNLTGAASTDPESQPLTYAWSFVSKPAGSTATLASPTSATPSFTPDLGGDYVVQLIVDDGTSASAPDSVTISTRRLLSLSPSSAALSLSGSVQLTVTAAYATPTPLVVTLTSSNTASATVPATVTIDPNQTTANFTVTGTAIAGGALIKATGGAGTGTAETVVAVGTRLVKWNVDASGFWDDSANWTDGAAPGPGDVVVIDRPAGNFTITISAPTAAIASLLSKEQLNIFHTLNANGPVALDGTTILNGQIDGTGSAVVNGPMSWDAGGVALAGGLEILAGQTLTMPNNNTARYVTDSSLLNHGTVVLGGSNALIGQGTATFTNAADGLWTSGTTYITTTSGASTFTNAGILRQVGGGGTFTLSGNIVYTSTGTLDVESGGALAVTSPATLTSSGVINLAPSTTFVLDRVTLAAGSSFSGIGTLTMTGTTTVTGNLTIPLPITLTDTLTGSGSVHLAAPMTWIQGIVSLAGGLEMLAGRTLTLPDNNVARYLTNSSLLNHGTVAMGNSNALIADGTCDVHQRRRRAVDLGHELPLDSSGASTFSNAGILRQLGNPGTFALARQHRLHEHRHT